MSNLGDAGVGSLRQAIIDANGNSSGVTDVIHLSVAGTIPLASALPAVTRAVLIDGATAPG